MRRLILFVAFLTFAQAIKDKCKVDYTSCPSGSKWSLCLEVKLSNDDSKMIVLKKDFGCTFKGHFLHRPGTTVFAAADNCPINGNTTDLRVTFLHPQCTGYKHNIVKTVSKSSQSVRPSTYTPPKNVDSIGAPPANIDYSNMYRSFPEDGFDFTIMVFYDELFLEYAAGGNNTVAFDRAYEIVNTAGSFYVGDVAEEGLGTKLHFIIEDIYLWTGQRLTSSDRYDEYLNYGNPSIIQKLLKYFWIDANHYVFLTWDSWSGGGIANLPGYKVGDEGVCGVKGKRASISSYGCIADPETRGKEDCPDKIQETAETVMHEIGHTLNMHHDFAFNGGHNPGWNGWGKTYLSQFCGRHERYCPDESDYFYGKSCTDVGGIMDYNFEASHYFLETCDNRWEDLPWQWSCCSRYDFLWYYNEMYNIYDEFCVTPHNYHSCQDNYDHEWCLAHESQCKDVLSIRNNCAETCKTFSDCTELSDHS